MKNERKTGWATITHKDGSSVTGEIRKWNEDSCFVSVCGYVRGFLIPAGVTITYTERPMPALPTKLGSVIEAGDGVRFFRSSGTIYPWISSILIDTWGAHKESSILSYCQKHGGFTIILEGKEPN